LRPSRCAAAVNDLIAWFQSRASIAFLPAACAERAEKFGRIGVYDSKSRDWVASLALVEKRYPDYKD